MGTFVQNLPILQVDDFVSVYDGGKPVGDHDYRVVPAHILQRFLDFGLIHCNFNIDTSNNRL